VRVDEGHHYKREHVPQQEAERGVCASVVLVVHRLHAERYRPVLHRLHVVSVVDNEEGQARARGDGPDADNGGAEQADGLKLLAAHWVDDGDVALEGDDR